MVSDETMSAAQLLVQCLHVQGCDRIFTVPGESFLPVLDALLNQPQIDVITCRQEGGAAFMACADGAITGRPGICFVTRGPGATNASIGVHVAQQDSQPMILFVGDVARTDRDREGFQEIDFPAFFGPVCKWAARLDDPARIPEYVARAYSTAISGRPGPVVLSLAEDMLSQIVSGSPRPRVERPLQAPAEADLTRMIQMLEASRAPVAIIGGAGWNAKTRTLFARFAEKAGIPVATAFRRQDAISPDSSIYAGNLGYGPNPKLVERIRSADLILAIGARLGEATTDGYRLVTPDHPGKKLVHVHPDPEELNRVYQADLAICADVTAFAETVVAYDYASATQSYGKDAHDEWTGFNTPEPAPFPLDLGLCVKAMRDLYPADTIICNGAGNYSGWWHRYWRYNGFPTQLAPTAGAMGYGLPAAISAALRFPDREVIALAGDGDFLMNGQEMATAAAYDLNLTILVLDNASYGTIRMHQEREFPCKLSATELVNPDFAALARAYGGWAERVETTDGFTKAIHQAKARRGIRLLHCQYDLEQLAASGLTLSQIQSRPA